MDFTVLIVVLLLGVGIPLRNKAIKEYREKRDKDNNLQKLTKGNDFCMGEVDWILCPFCGSKTRTKIRKDTVLINFRQGCYYH